MSGDRAAADLVLATSLGEAKGGLAVAAAVGVALSRARPSVLVAELGASARRGPTMLAAGAARELEDALRSDGFERVAARGRVCWLGLGSGDDALAELGRAVAALPPEAVAVAHLPAGLWQSALGGPTRRPVAALLRADLPVDRSLTAMTVIELRARGVPVRVASRPLGRVAARRSLAGLEAGGAASNRSARLARGLEARGPHGRRAPRPRRGSLMAERGQALMMMVAAAFALLFCAAILAAIGGAVTGTARTQRVADLAALSGARSLRDDFTRLFVPARLPSGASNPQHLDKGEYLDRAAAAARQAAMRNGVDPDRLRVAFPDRDSFAPVRVKASVTATLETHGMPGRPSKRPVRIEESGEAEASPPAAAAKADGISLVINSAFRSDAEQAELWEQNPDPRWVAPPGQSLHRCATELDLGPPSAYSWLAAHTGEFDFLQRY